MASLAELLADPSRHLSMQVWIGRVLIRPSSPTDPDGVPGVSSIRISKSYSSPNPVATIGVNKIPDWVLTGQQLVIRLGYNNQFHYVFNGTVQSREPKTGGETHQIIGTGQLLNAFRKTEIGERDVDGLTVQQAISSLLDAAGVGTRLPGRFLNIPAYDIGGAANIDAKLQRMSIASMLQKLMEIDGLRMTERGSGLIVIEPVDLAPAPTPFRTYDTDNSGNPHIMRGRTQEDPLAISTRVRVTGATVTSGTPPNETSTLISGIANLVDTSLVKPPLGVGEHIEVVFSMPLVDENSKALDIAARLLSEVGRLPRTINLKLPGDPQLQLGHTLRINLPEIGVEGDFIVSSLDHTINERTGYHTICGLIGGTGGAVTINLPPIADFDITIMHRVVGTQVFAFVTFDGSASSDPDGDTIIKYQWSDNQVTSPEITTYDGPVANVRIDPGFAGQWDVTLTVTDALGQTGTLTKFDIDVEVTSSEVSVPALFAASGTQFMASPDGGQNWKDLPAFGGVGNIFTAVAARPPDRSVVGWAVVGMSDGRILFTTDFTEQSLGQALAPTGDQIEDIEWDWRQPRDVWAVNTVGKVYRSVDYGRTFRIYADLRTVLSDSNITTYHIALPAIGGVWIYGGNGNGLPLAVTSPSVANPTFWQTMQMVSGELSDDSPGPAGIHIVDTHQNEEGRGFVMILADAGGAGGVRGLYHCDNIEASQPNWLRGISIPAALTEGRYVVGEFGGLFAFHAAFDDRDVYHSADGVNWRNPSEDVLPAGVTPNHAIWEADEIHAQLLPSVHVIAGEDAGGTQGIFLSTDGIQTANLIRPATGFDPWVAGAKAKQVALGPSPGTDGRLVTVSEQPSDDSRWVARRLFNPNWQQEDIPALLSSSIYNRIRALTDQIWFVFGFDNNNDYASVVPMRTADAGDTFAEMASPGGTFKFIDVARAADGRLWGLAIDTAAPEDVRIYYSDTGGDDGNWILDYGTVDHGTHGLCTIYTHPTHIGRIYVTGHKDTSSMRTIFTVDGGVDGWNVNTAINITGTDRGMQMDYRALAASGVINRLVCIHVSVNGADKIFTSDNNGGLWTIRWPVIGGIGSGPVGSFLMGPVGTVLGGILYVAQHENGLQETIILRSLNGGQTWNPLRSHIAGNDVGETPTGGVAYDDRENAIYIKFSGGHTVERAYIYRMSPVTDAGSWEDVTGDLFPPGVSSLANTGRSQSMDIVP